MIVDWRRAATTTPGGKFKELPREEWDRMSEEERQAWARSDEEV